LSSPRSSPAHAFVSGLVELSRRMKPGVRELADSYAAKASNGLVVKTPPKSQRTAVTSGPPRRSLAVSTDGTLGGGLRPSARWGSPLGRSRMLDSTAVMPVRHVIVDGSNLATEGRSMPSLDQLDQAVRE